MSDASLPWTLDRYAGKAGWRRRACWPSWCIATARSAALPDVDGAGAATAVQVAEVVFLAVFVVVFAWIAISFWSGLFGFLLGVLRLPSGDPAPTPAGRRRDPGAARAHGDPDAGLQRGSRPTSSPGSRRTIARSRRPGRLDAFDFFVLSDTTRCRDRRARRSGLVASCASGCGGRRACSIAGARSNTRQEGRQHRRMDRRRAAPTTRT